MFDPLNPHVLGPHLACAASELPLREAELSWFSAAVDADARQCEAATVAAVLDEVTAAGRLRRRPAGWFWTGRGRPDVDIRGTGGAPVAVVEGATGALIGTVDAAAAHSTVHPGAVYLHQGRAYVVDQLDLTDGVAAVHAESPPWSTAARDVTDIAIVAEETGATFGDVRVSYGTVEVSNQVVGYLRRRLDTGERMDETPLDLPARQLSTRAVWYTISQQALDAAGLDPSLVPGAAHAAEHAAIGLLPLFATCDRWDIGGVSTALHPDTGAPTVFVYDGHAGGAGFARRGHDALPRWLRATREAIAGCECPAGCPSCVQSPKCGNGNEPLDKAGAVTLLDLVLRALAG